MIKDCSITTTRAQTLGLNGSASRALRKFNTRTACIGFALCELLVPIQLALAASSEFLFDTSELYVREDEGVALVQVLRGGDLSKPAQLAYTITDGSARAGVDFLAVTGTLTFAHGVTNQQFSVVILDNGRLDPVRTATLTLRDPVGATLAAERSTASLTIWDNEIPFMVDPSFQAQVANDRGSYVLLSSPFAVQPDGGVVAAVSISKSAFNSERFWKLARLHADGAPDPGFRFDAVTTTFPIGELHALLALPDGRILLGSSVETSDGFESSSIARLQPNGSIDKTFKCQGVGDYVRQIVVQPDGKLIVLAGTIMRLNPDGSVDPSFKSGMMPPCGQGLAMALQSDGKILLAFDLFDECRSSDTGLVRLHSDGSRDDTFHSLLKFGLGTVTATPIVSMMLMQPNGQIIIGGSFDSVNGTVQPGVARLNPDGSLDSAFRSAFQPNRSRRAIGAALQSDGKILTSFYLGYPSSDIERYNADGSRDGTFRVPFAGTVSVLPDGKLMVRQAYSGALFRVFEQPALLSGFGFSHHSFMMEHDGRITVPESRTEASFEVFRYGETSAGATVHYATRDGTAKAGEHYEAENGTLTFAPLERNKLITVAVKPNSTGGRAKNFTVVLSDPSGGNLLGLAKEMSVTLEPGSLLTVQWTNDGIKPRARLRLSPTTPGAAYLLQSATSFTASPGFGAWKHLGEKTATSETLEFEDFEVGSLDRKFYRTIRRGP